MGSTQPLTERSTRNFPGGKGRPARRADNLTAFCEPIVYTKCGSLDVSQSYRPSRPLTGIALPLSFYAVVFQSILRCRPLTKRDAFRLLLFCSFCEAVYLEIFGLKAYIFRKILLMRGNNSLIIVNK
jgi:hypothetical protein